MKETRMRLHLVAISLATLEQLAAIDADLTKLK
jgi:hypothetical protein